MRFPGARYKKGEESVAGGIFWAALLFFFVVEFKIFGVQYQDQPLPMVGTQTAPGYTYVSSYQSAAAGEVAPLPVNIWPSSQLFAPIASQEVTSPYYYRAPVAHSFGYSRGY
jgi:tellurite resistance protein TehA-like permease